MLNLTNSDKSLRRVYFKYIRPIVFGIAINVTGINAAEFPSVNLDIKRDVQEEKLKRLAGKVILITGDADNALMGAILAGKHCIVYVKQMDSWPAGLYGKRLTVKGILSVKFYEKQKRGEPRLPILQGFIYSLDLEKVLTVGQDKHQRVEK